MFNQKTKSIRIKPDFPVAGNPTAPPSTASPTNDAKSSSASKGLLYFNPSNFTKLFKNSSNFVQTTFSAAAAAQQNPTANNNNNNSYSPNQHIQQQQKQAQAHAPPLVAKSYQDHPKTNTTNQIVIENGSRALQFTIPSTKSPTLSSSSLPANASNYYSTLSGTKNDTVIQLQHSEKALSSPEMKKCSTPPMTSNSRTYNNSYRATPTKTLSAPVLSDPSEKMTNNGSIVFQTVKLGNKKSSLISNDKLDSSMEMKEMAKDFYEDRNNNQCKTEEMHVKYNPDKAAMINRDAKNESHVSVSLPSMNDIKYMNTSRVQSMSPVHSNVSRCSNTRPIVTQSLDNGVMQTPKQTVATNSLKINFDTDNISKDSSSNNNLDFNLRECMEQMNASSFIEKSNFNFFHSQDNNGMLKFSQDPLESLYNTPSQIKLPNNGASDDNARPTSPNSSSSSSSSSPSSSSSSTSNSPTENKSNSTSNNSGKKISNAASNSIYNNILSNYTQTLVVPKSTELDDIKEVDVDEDGNPIYNNNDTYFNWHLRHLSRTTSSFPSSAASFAAAASSLTTNLPSNNRNPFLQLMANPTALNNVPPNNSSSIFSSNGNGTMPVSINDHNIFNNTCKEYTPNESNKLFTSSLASLVNEMAMNDVLNDTHFSKIAHPDKVSQSFNANGTMSNFECKVNGGNLNSQYIAPDVMNMLQLYLKEHGNEYIKQFLQVIESMV